MDRKEFQDLLRQGQLRGVYLFDGPEENVKAAALQAVRKALLPEGLEDLNEAILENPPSDELIAAAQTLPFAADKRLIVVREHPALGGRGDADERLLTYLEQIPDSCILIFYCRGKSDGRKKLCQKIKQCGTIVSFDPLSEQDLISWVIRTFSAQDKLCAKPTA